MKKYYVECRIREVDTDMPIIDQREKLVRLRVFNDGTVATFAHAAAAKALKDFDESTVK